MSFRITFYFFQQIDTPFNQIVTFYVYKKVPAMLPQQEPFNTFFFFNLISYLT